VGEDHGLSDGPALHVDHMDLYRLLADEAFYAALPPGTEDLAGPAREVRRRATRIALDRGTDCGACGDLRRALRPFLTELGGRLAAVHAADPGALALLAGVVARQRGYRPRPVVLYHLGADGGVKALRF
jgi:hypothetical protein